MDSTPLPPQITINGVQLNATPGQRPVRVDGCITISDLFQSRCAELGDRTAHREKDLGIWKSYSWTDYWQHAKWIGLALRKLGLERGEVVSILSEDRKEWAWFDMGIQGVGGISSGIYTTDAAKQVQYLINDSDSRFLVVENEEQLDKFLEVEDEVPGLLKVIILEDEGLHDLDHPRCMMIEDLYALGKQAEAEDPGRFEAEIALAKPQDTALLVYTSGTTGQPKGAMLSHENILAGIECGARALPTLASDEQLCFLPLCHILERDVSVFFPLAARCTVNFAESPETVFANLQEVSPTTFTAVPACVGEDLCAGPDHVAGCHAAGPVGLWSGDKGRVGKGRVSDDGPTCPDPCCRAVLGLGSSGAAQSAADAGHGQNAPRRVRGGADLT